MPLRAYDKIVFDSWSAIQNDSVVRYSPGLEKDAKREDFVCALGGSRQKLAGVITYLFDR